MMNSRNLDNLVELDLLNKEPGDQQEFDGLLRYGRGSLKDAGREALEIASRFQLAYEGAHSLALAALRWCGYRPRNKRYIVFQCLPHTLGVDNAGWRILAEAHERRNRMAYEGELDVEEQLITEMLETAAEVLDRVSSLGPVVSPEE
jgi:hypothetical protein